MKNVNASRTNEYMTAFLRDLAEEFRHKGYGEFIFSTIAADEIRRIRPQPSCLSYDGLDPHIYVFEKQRHTYRGEREIVLTMYPAGLFADGCVVGTWEERFLAAVKIIDLDFQILLSVETTRGSTHGCKHELFPHRAQRSLLRKVLG
jgi:hypothetical protein